MRLSERNSRPLCRCGGTRLTLKLPLKNVVEQENHALVPYFFPICELAHVYIVRGNLLALDVKPVNYSRRFWHNLLSRIST